MDLKEILIIAGQLTAVAAALGPTVEFVVTLAVWIARKKGKPLADELKQALAGLLSIGGAVVIAGSAGIVPWKYAAIGAVFGLGSWYVANRNHEVSKSNTKESLSP